MEEQFCSLICSEFEILRKIDLWSEVRKVLWDRGESNSFEEENKLQLALLKLQW